MNGGDAAANNNKKQRQQRDMMNTRMAHTHTHTHSSSSNNNNSSTKQATAMRTHRKKTNKRQHEDQWSAHIPLSLSSREEKRVLLNDSYSEPRVRSLNLRKIPRNRVTIGAVITAK